MKSLLELVKTTVVGGLMVILPLLAVYKPLCFSPNGGLFIG